MVYQADGHCAGDKSHFSETLGERFEFVRPGVLKDGGVILEGCGCPGLGLWDFADHLDRRLRDAFLVPLEVDLPITADLNLAPFRQCVDSRHTDAMQTAGNFVTGAAKLPPGMQGGHDDLKGGYFHLGVDVNGDAAAIVDHGDAFIFIDDNVDFIARPSQGFVDGVVDHFMDQVMKCLGICTADIHARAAAYSLKTFENLDIICIVGKRLFRQADYSVDRGS